MFANPSFCAQVKDNSLNSSLGISGNISLYGNDSSNADLSLRTKKLFYTITDAEIVSQLKLSEVVQTVFERHISKNFKNFGDCFKDFDILICYKNQANIGQLLCKTELT